MDSANVENAVREYELTRPSYEKLCEEISELIEDALAEANIDIAGFSERAKSVESFREKISRKEYDNPLDQTEDLAGVRIVCLYDEDREQIARICANEFELLKTEDRGRALGADRMGYSGTHLIVRLGPAYSGGRYKGITNLKCEVQIRTAVQDAWAMISHGMVYKNEEDVPIELRRDLNHAASLLEIAQSKFDELRVKRAQYLAEIDTEISTAIQTEEPKLLDRKINFDTLSAYIRWKFPNVKPDDTLTRLVIQDIDGDRFRKIADIDVVVERAKQAVDAYSARAPQIFKNGTDFVTKSLGFADEGFRNKHAFGSPTREAFSRYDHLVAQS
ncbi:hypothetical protein [Mesorhizobium sp.]|uniref:GTP pyrophosphokinase n=1 Tax=Mesorhizobium sp. TaxID=1871066 RepID=UPI000FEA23C4|nr:hypothetical protein [Mesorhizobium sp.]RWA58062.1 MAG: hypothetical protein EOQ27_31220 [Mesorhizobium sp.]